MSKNEKTNIHLREV